MPGREKGVRNVRILAVSDEAPQNRDGFAESVLEGIDLILSCGDLPADYLTFLADRCNGPLLYVRGNHDRALLERPPGGCICIENRIYVHHGIRILGLGGSMRYNDGALQYSQRGMRLRAMRMKLPLLKSGGFDILLTHAPAEGLGDLEDTAHRGFRAFRLLLDQYAPALHIHGHVHMRYGKTERESRYRGTKIVNACGYHILEL